LAADDGSGVLRDRDDERDLFRVRHRASRIGSLSPVAASGRFDDRERSRGSEDGPGVFDNYAVVQGVDTIIPVDVYVPGCPPTPDGLLYAVNLIQQQIREGGRGGLLARA
jgi:coenzyme F420-reducing hydrogenase gamma subunit